MTQTPFEDDRMKFSLAAHNVAKGEIYPEIFKLDRDELDFDYPGGHDTAKQQIMDQDLSIDVTCKVTVDHLKNPVHTTFQERWRGYKKDPRKYMKYQDVTVTEINELTGTKSEHYKISSGFHLYGYFDSNIDKVLEAIAFSVPNWQLHVINGNFNTTKNQHPTSKSTFIGYDFDELKKLGVAVFHIKYGLVKHHELN